MNEQRCTVLSPTPVPDDLVDAFWRYDTALLTNDVATMDALFASGPDTLRGDAAGLLVGHDAITGFRNARAKIPTRAIERLHARHYTDDLAVLVAETRDGDRMGLQTQVWSRTESGWQISVAHVAAPS